MSKSDPQFAIQERFLDQPYQLAERLIDPVSGTLSWQGKREHLRRKELEVLALLASAEGKQVSRDNFIAVVWQGNDLVGDRGLSNTIVFVRKSLRDEDTERPIIRTIPRRGYQLAVPVLEPTEPAAEAVVARLEPGEMIPECPGWRLVKRLGELNPDGGLASDTWLAEPSEFGEREQGLRVFRFCRSEAHLQRLRREVTLLRYVRDALAENPRFAVIRDWQLEEPPYFLARDYTTFGSLRQWNQLAEQPFAGRIRMMSDLSEAVAAMHVLGVVHRQLNVDTILVDQSASAASDALPQLKISAFDLAALSDRRELAPLNITALGLTLGVEEASVKPTAAEDIGALGLIFLQLTLGDWRAEAKESWLNQVSNVDLKALLRRCVGQTSERPSAAELAGQLHRFAAPKASEEAGEKATVSPALVTPLEAQESEVQAASIERAVPNRSAPVKAKAGLENIGPYRLLDQLGEGGMGTVYLAEQRDPYRKVALKIIRSGLDGKQILSRFDAERQALAMMNHPNVASIHDSGLADDGRPYFAMEYIAGDDINTYCDAHHLNINERIKLFLQVCDGVLHAHQKGVLHRDIKPSNLMVSSATESAGTVKIIDFGLAKSLHGKLASQTLHTSFGAFIGTPVYSSPEHVSGAAAGVDTRSDIYSMGVVLYELLAGSTPIAGESLENLAPAKIRELVCRSKLPSMREQLQNTSAEKLKELAERRSIKLDELPKTLEGDLSWVVGKCLERDPNDRYASVLELKRDLERWLDFRPVEAKPTTGWYRFRKYVRRNRLVVSAAGVFALALLGTTTAAVIGFIRAKHAATEANMAADFQVKQMQSVDPAAMGVGLRGALISAASKYGIERGWDATTLAQHQRKVEESLQGINFTDLTREQLDTYSLKPALASIKKDFVDYPLLQARLLETMAETLGILGRYEEALEAIETALTQRRRRGNDVPAIVNALLFRSDALEKLNRFNGAEADAREALSVARRELGDRAAYTLMAQGQLAWVRFRQGMITEALKQGREALAGLRDTLGDGHPDTLKVMRQVITFHRISGENREALALGEAALSASRRSLGNQDALTFKILEDLAVVYLAERRYAESETLMRQVVGAVSQKRGDTHPETLSSLKNLAKVLASQGKYAENLALLSNHYKSVAQDLGVEHPDALGIRALIGYCLRVLGRSAEAESVLQEELVSLRRVYGDGHIEVANVQVLLARALQDQEKLAEATETAVKSFETYDRIGNVGAFYPTENKRVIGSVLHLQGRYRDAEAYLRGAYEALIEKLGPDDILVAEIGQTLAVTMAAQNKIPEAIALYESSLRVFQVKMGNEDRQTLWVNRGLAEIRGATEVSAALIAEQQASLQTIVKTFDEGHPDTLQGRLLVAKLLFRNSQPQQAQDFLENTLPKLRESFGDQHRDTISALDLLSQIHRKRGNLAESLKLAEEIAISSGRFAESPHFVGNLQVHHAQTLIDLGRFADAARVLAKAKNNLSQADGAPKQDMEALAQAYTALHGQR